MISPSPHSNLENPFAGMNLTMRIRGGKIIVFVLFFGLVGVNRAAAVLKGAHLAVEAGPGHDLTPSQRLHRLAQIDQIAAVFVFTQFDGNVLIVL